MVAKIERGMKKALIYIIGLVAIFSCDRMDPFSGSPDKAIVFSDVQTKAIVSSADEILSMGVLAQMNLGAEGESGYNDYTMILDNEHVSRTSSSAPWTYEHTRYWVPDRAFHFFAVWPYSGDENSPVSNVSSTEGDGPFSYNVTFTTPENADQELLTAVKTERTVTGNAFPAGVDFQFEHQLTNVHFKIWRDAKDDNEEENLRDKIRVKQVSIRNVTKTATLSTNGVGSSSSWNYSSEKMTFSKDYEGNGIDVAAAKLKDGKINEVDEGKNPKPGPGIPFGDDGLLLIPHTINNSNAVIIKVVYDLLRPIDQGQDEEIWEENKVLQAFLPDGTWLAGKKVTYNVLISGERTITEFQINTVVEDWNRQTDKIDFTQQVEVREGEEMKWVEGTYESINPNTGEVVLFTDIDMVATCEFNIRTPIGATWTASLIPLTASAMDAFSIVEDSKYGDVGTNQTQRVKIKINNPDPISARNACLLRITVQTSDGRTIVVKNLMPPEIAAKGVEEYTIIQNLING